MNSRVVVGIVALTVALSAVAAAAAYFFDAVTPALALGAVAAVLALLSFLVAGVALARQQGVVSEQTSLAVLVDKSLVRMGRRIDEQEVKFAAARAVGGHRAAAQPTSGEADAPMPRADAGAVTPPGPRTAIEVAGTKPEPAERERHKAKFLPPADMTTVEYERRDTDAEVEFGKDFEITLEPIVAIPSGNIAAYRVFAGFRQADGNHVHIAETPSGYWGDKDATFAEALVAAAAATAERHFDAAGDVRLYLPLPTALLENQQAAQALAQRYGDHPVMRRIVVATIRASLAAKGGDELEGRIAALAEAGASLALHLDDEEADIVALARRFRAAAVFAEVEQFPLHGAAGWTSTLMAETDALVMATGVRTEASVIAMMDLNVGYMSGPLFAEPKRLKAGEAILADA